MLRAPKTAAELLVVKQLRVEASRGEGQGQQEWGVHSGHGSSGLPG